MKKKGSLKYKFMHKYEVEFSMKDNTIVCSGVDRVRNSTISCELKVGDTLVLTERGIHSCISIKTVPIKIKRIFPSVTDNLLFYDFFKKWFLDKFGMTPKEVHITNMGSLNDLYNR